MKMASTYVSKKPGSRRFKTYNETHSKSIAAGQVLRELNALFEAVGLESANRAVSYHTLQLRSRNNDGDVYANALAISDLLTLWHQHPNFVDSAGNPVPIRRRAGKNSFMGLAKLAAPGTSATKLLIELERLHLVTVDKKKLIHVRRRSLHMYTDKHLRALHTLRTLRGFMYTLRHNLRSHPSNSEQLFHQVAWNGNFSTSEIPRLKIWLRRYGQGLLESADSWMLRRSGAVRNLAHPRKTAQVSIGVYLSVMDKRITSKRLNS
jgi:hypothetical protein